MDAPPRSILLPLLALLLTLVFYAPTTLSEPPHFDMYPPLPLCASQYALAGHACAKVPYSPLPPPSPQPPPPSPDSPPSSRRHHHHRRHHHRRSGEEPTPAQEECCKWLKEMDSQCACELLVRLPSFLTRPSHNYTVVVSDECSVNFTCPGRLVP